MKHMLKLKLLMQWTQPIKICCIGTEAWTGQLADPKWHGGDGGRAGEKEERRKGRRWREDLWRLMEGVAELIVPYRARWKSEDEGRKGEGGRGRGGRQRLLGGWWGCCTTAKASKRWRRSSTLLSIEIGVSTPISFFFGILLDEDGNCVENYADITR